MARDIKQQIAELEARLARAREKDRARDTRCKIIAGAIVITEALKDPSRARRLVQLFDTHVTRDVDKAAIADLVKQLHGVAAQATTPQAE